MAADGPTAPVVEVARAKVNLFLHVLGRRPDGRHRLQSLAVFPELGDVLAAEPARGRSLSVAGPFGDALGADGDNLVIRAMEALAAATGTDRGAALRLDKRLPIASGVGGGSADAAAALRALTRLWGLAPAPGLLDRVALGLGADVPVCLRSAPAMMAGIGERLAPAPALPGFWMVLVNPLRGLSTAAVFAALDRRRNPPCATVPAGFADLAGLAAWLADQRNDLEATAIGLAPVIAEMLTALRAAPGCALARMSGSGATTFGLFADAGAALDASAALRRAHPGWWVAPAAAPSAPHGGGEGLR